MDRATAVLERRALDQVAVAAGVGARVARTSGSVQAQISEARAVQAADLAVPIGGPVVAESIGMQRYLVVAVLTCAACTDGPPPNASLADLPGLRLAIQIWRSADAEPTPGFVNIGYDVEAFRAAHAGACAVLGDYDVRWEGAGIGHQGRGSENLEFDGCYEPSFEFAFDRIGEQASTLRITDGSHTIDAMFSAEQLAPHQPTLRSPSTWQFSGGEAVVLGWSHPEDFADPSAFDDPVYFHTGTIANGNYFDLVDLTFVGDEIRFTIPDPPPITGDGFIVARFGYVNGDALSCTGATPCTFSREAGYSHSVVIAR